MNYTGGVLETFKHEKAADLVCPVTDTVVHLYFDDIIL